MKPRFDLFLGSSWACQVLERLVFWLGFGWWRLSGWATQTEERGHQTGDPTNHKKTHTACVYSILCSCRTVNFSSRKQLSERRICWIGCCKYQRLMRKTCIHTATSQVRGKKKNNFIQHPQQQMLPGNAQASVPYTPRSFHFQSVLHQWCHGHSLLQATPDRGWDKQMGVANVE